MPTSSRRFRRDRWHAKLLESLRRQPPEWRRALVAEFRDAATRHDLLIYSDPTTSQPVRIQPVPWLLTEAQCRYLQVLGIRLRRMLNRLLSRYFDDPALQAVLPLDEDERSWMQALLPKGFLEPAAVFERLDTNLAFEDDRWPDGLRFLELNSVGVGCVHFMPVANQLIADRTLAVFQEAVAPKTCRPTADPRVLLRRQLEAHANAIGRSQLVTAFVERRETSEGGADEMLQLSRWFQDQGLHAVVADPRDLEVRNEELVYKDATVDLVYRDFALSEILSIEKHGGQVEAMKHAFRRNQVVSSLTGEFDHKSLFELLSNPEYDKYFTPAQQRVSRAFVPWTRLVRERKTSDPDGRQEVDLPAYVRSHRQTLVLKPNRGYGGQDVVIGMDAADAAWDEALGRALAHPDTWVVQHMTPLPQAEFPDPKDLQDLTAEFVTVGFIATTDGIAFVGRSSTDRIVNISRGGSLVPIFLIG